MTKRANRCGSTGNPRSISTLTRCTVPRPGAATRPGTTTSLPLPCRRNRVPRMPAARFSASFEADAECDAECECEGDGEGDALLDEALGPREPPISPPVPTIYPAADPG